ncbi:hypothetical protein [Baaleninema sp.]|uniref:hypothetical protein n=1 Tax=Baaleninema sp. TaxID=3101197 RepID=UPI003D01F866
MACGGTKKGEKKEVIDGTSLTTIKKRPSWRKSTKKILKQKYPKFHDGHKLKPGYNRRHQVPFETIYKSLRHKLQGKTYNRADLVLKNLGFKPKSKKKADILKAARKYLIEKFNDLDNLWVGKAKENQEKGRAISRLLSNLKKLQSQLKAIQKESQSQNDSKRKAGAKAKGREITKEITSVVAQLRDARLDLPEKGTIKEAEKVKAEYMRMLKEQMKRDQKLVQ